MAIGARLTNNQQIKEIVINWLNTSFEGGRHQERINLIEKYENNLDIYNAIKEELQRERKLLK